MEEETVYIDFLITTTNLPANDDKKNHGSKQNNETLSQEKKHWVPDQPDHMNN